MIPVWKAPPTDFTLSEKEVHIWRAALDLPDETAQELKEKLSIDEQVKAECFRFERDRKRFIARHGILRMILGCYLGVQASELQFYNGKNGKPSLSDAFGNRIIHFNMSHSGGLALYGFTRDRQIGVDVECVRDIPEMLGIAKQIFSTGENQVFGSLGEKEKKKAFFDWWTRKEAFVKATGDGLSQALDKIDVTLMEDEVAGVIRIERGSKTAPHWFIQDLHPASGVVGAFAIEDRGWRLQCWQWLA